MSEKDLSTSSALLIGGTSGVGLASAIGLARAGVPRIALGGRDSGRGEAAAATVRALGSHCTFIEVDAGSAVSAVETAIRAEDILDGIDILSVSTAPRVSLSLFSRMPMDVIESTLVDLVMPVMNMVHAVTPGMRARQHGVIVTVASDAAKTPTPGESVIGAAMAAIVMFTRAIAMEEKRSGIRANVLTPSLIADTGLTPSLMAGEFSGPLFEKAAKLASLGVPEAADIAALLVFLAGPGGRRLTGQAISVNGGISAA